MQREELENIGSLIALKGGKFCLGYLLFSEAHGCYDATHGKIPVTKEEADQHNAAFDKAMVDGLASCPVGRGGCFYYNAAKRCVQTWLGTLIAEGANITTTTRKVCFRYRHSDGSWMSFSGFKKQVSDDIFFTRRV